MKKNYLKSLLSAGAVVAMACNAVGADMVHGYSMGSTAREFGFISFTTDGFRNLAVDKGVSQWLPQVSAGEWVDGKYYTFRSSYNDWLYALEQTDFSVYDTANGFSTVRTVAAPGPRVTDMTFDYTTNTMYALVEDAASWAKIEAGLSETTWLKRMTLHVVDMETGKLIQVGDFGGWTALDGYNREVETWPVALACDAHGTLWAMGVYRHLYNIDKMTGKGTRVVDSRHGLATQEDFQSMAFDSEGTLWWSNSGPDHFHFVKVDTATDEAIGVDGVSIKNSADAEPSRYTNDNQVSGIYFEHGRVEGSSPNAVTELVSVRRAGTANTVDLSWTLPTTAYDGSPVDIKSVKVYRFGTSGPVATLAPDATVAEVEGVNGNNVFMVVAEGADHAGFPAWTEVFAGADRLKAVGNLEAVLEGNSVTLTWDAPTETVNGGYADYNNITYIVKRLAGSTSEVIADDLTDTSLVAELPKVGTYTFEVTAVTGGVEGEAAVSNEVTLVGGAASLPYSTGFEDEQDGTQWIAANHEGAGSYGWSITLGYAYQRYDGKFATAKTGGSDNVADDWLISPAIHFTPGAHTLEMMVKTSSYDSQDFAVWLGTDASDTSSFIVPVASEQEFMAKDWTSYKKKFFVENEGDYHLGLRYTTPRTFSNLSIDNLSVAADKSGVTAVSAEREAESSAAEYFNMQGIRVEPVSPGLYIRKCGDRAEKVIVR